MLLFGHVEGGVPRYGQLAANELDQSPVVPLQLAGLNAAVDVVEIADCGLTTGQSCPQLLGVRLTTR
jgi:hypothetical protein